MSLHCMDCKNYLLEDERISRNQGKIQWVVLINLLMMVGEIGMGYLSQSMALLAEGWHMASHAGVLGIAWVAYRLARSPRLAQRFSFGTGKLLPLGGYTSAVALGLVAILVVIESLERLWHPVGISYNEAIGVAIVGIVVNSMSALILQDDLPHSHGHDAILEGDHDHHHHHDHNLRSAFLHVIADAVTSLMAVIALFAAKYLTLPWLDPLMGLVGAGVILSWSYQLCRDTAWELLDGHAKTVNFAQLQIRIEKDCARIVDFHAWRIAPQAVACELVVETPALRGVEYYRGLLRDGFGIRHSVIEEREAILK